MTSHKYVVGKGRCILIDFLGNYGYYCLIQHQNLTNVVFLRLTSIWNLKLSINILNTVILKPTGLFGTWDLLPTHGIEIPYQSFGKYQVASNLPNADTFHYAIFKNKITLINLTASLFRKSAYTPNNRNTVVPPDLWEMFQDPQWMPKTEDSN